MPRLNIHLRDLDDIEDLLDDEELDNLAPAIRPAQRPEIRFGSADTRARKYEERRKQSVRSRRPQS